MQDWHICHSFLDTHQHISNPSVLVWVLQEADAKMRLDVQEIIKERGEELIEKPSDYDR